MDHDPAFVGQSRGLGLFLPGNRGGWTEDLIFDGPGVQHIKASEQAPWQEPYSICDNDNDGYVFVPTSPECECVLFRAQHSVSKKTHALVHEEGAKVMLVPLAPMDPGAEVTFDYFGPDRKAGAGWDQTRAQWDALEERMRLQGSQDQWSDGGFCFAQNC